MRWFVLERMEDVSGVSGTGTVAVGCVLRNGKVLMTWLTGEYHAVSVKDGLEEVLEVHGHSGRTELHWLEDVELSRLDKLRWLAYELGAIMSAAAIRRWRQRAHHLLEKSRAQKYSSDTAKNGKRRR